MNHFRASTTSRLTTLMVLLLLVATEASAQVTLQQARALRIEGKTTQAIEALGNIVQREPENFLAQYNLGLALASSDDLQKARDPLVAAAALRDKAGSGDPTVYNSAGWVLMQTGDPQAAVPYFEKGLALESELSATSKARLLNNFGLTLLQVGDHERARTMLVRARDEFKSKQAGANLDLLDALTSGMGPWIVIFGADTTFDAAQHEVKRAEVRNYSPMIVKRNGSFRSIAVFDDKADADKALAVVKQFRPDAYIVRKRTWCPNLIEVPGQAGTCGDT